MSTDDGEKAEIKPPKGDGVLVLAERKKLRRQAALDRSAGGSEKPRSVAMERRAPRERQRPLPEPEPVPEEDEDDLVTPFEGTIRPPAAATRIRGRHWGAILSFLLMVVAPVSLSGWYLWNRAADRYLSTAAFSVRNEEATSAFELLGGVVDVGSSSSSDNDILYDFIQSQELVARIDAQIDLRAVWSRNDPAVDPVFAYHPPGTIEDMVTYWNRMVSIYNDSSTGLMYLEVQAFTPEDAHRIAQLIYDESSIVINRLSDIAQEDSTRFARLELEESVNRLKPAREALTLFRNQYQIVDPASDMQSQIGVLASLQAELATTLIDLDILRQTTAESDPRIVQAERRVAVIEARIADERTKFGMGSGGTGPAPIAQDGGYAEIVGEYERLIVDLQFAEQSYAAARSAFDVAMSETRKKNRYIAAHVQPTLAERADHPQRELLLALVALFSLLIWALAVLVAYALKDRR